MAKAKMSRGFKNKGDMLEAGVNVRFFWKEKQTIRTGHWCDKHAVLKLIESQREVHIL